MSKPAHGPTRPGDDRTDPEPSRAEIDIVNERDRDYRTQREAARPAHEACGTAPAPSSRCLSRPVRITPLAEADIERAQDDYEAREHGLGNHFVLPVRVTLDRIAVNPFQYQIVSVTRDAQRARVHDFPFGLLYRVEPAQRTARRKSPWSIAARSPHPATPPVAWPAGTALLPRRTEASCARREERTQGPSGGHRRRRASRR